MTGGWRRFLPGKRGAAGAGQILDGDDDHREDAAGDINHAAAGEPDADAVDLQLRSPESGLRYGDIAVLGGLMEAGADLTRPRPVLWYVHLRNKASAEALARDAQGAGYVSRIIKPSTSGSAPDMPGSDGRPWTVCCELTESVVDIAFVLDNDAVLTNLAEPHDGILASWEAGLRPDEGTPAS